MSIDGRVHSLNTPAYQSLQHLQPNQEIGENQAKTITETILADGHVDASEADLLEELLANQTQIEVSTEVADFDPINISFNGISQSARAEFERALSFATSSTDPIELPSPAELTGEDVVRFIDERLGGIHTLGGRDVQYSPEQIESLNELGIEHKQILHASLQQLEHLQNGEIDGAEYMVSMMQEAANIAGDDSDLFLDLVGAVFSSQQVGGAVVSTARWALGAGEHPMGSFTEASNVSIMMDKGGSTPETGFNANIIDNNPVSSIPHHFGELLRVGASSGSMVAHETQKYLDVDDRHATVFMDAMTTREANPGDYRSGTYAGFLGAALANEKISPQDAVHLTEWLYTHETISEEGVDMDRDSDADQMPLTDESMAAYQAWHTFDESWKVGVIDMLVEAYNESHNEQIELNR